MGMDVGAREIVGTAWPGRMRKEEARARMYLDLPREHALTHLQVDHLDRRQLVVLSKAAKANLARGRIRDVRAPEQVGEGKGFGGAHPHGHVQQVCQRKDWN